MLVSSLFVIGYRTFYNPHYITILLTWAGLLYVLAALQLTTCGSPLNLSPSGVLRLPAGKHISILTYLQTIVHKKMAKKGFFLVIPPLGRQFETGLLPSCMLLIYFGHNAKLKALRSGDEYRDEYIHELASLQIHA